MVSIDFWSNFIDRYSLFDQSLIALFEWNFIEENWSGGQKAAPTVCRQKDSKSFFGHKMDLVQPKKEIDFWLLIYLLIIFILSKIIFSIGLVKIQGSLDNSSFLILNTISWLESNSSLYSHCCHVFVTFTLHRMEHFCPHSSCIHSRLQQNSCFIIKYSRSVRLYVHLMRNQKCVSALAWIMHKKRQHWI